MDTPTIELVTTERPVPLNGAPVSADYNDTQSEILTDLASISDFLNSLIVPALKSLPEMATVVLDGSHLYADRSAASGLCFDSVDKKPLTISQVLSRFEQTIRTVQSRVDDIEGRVKHLQNHLAATGQNDVARAIHGFADSLRAIDQRVSTLENVP